MTTRRRFTKFWNNDRKEYRILKFLVKFNLFAVPLYVALILSIQFPQLQVWMAQLTEQMLLETGIAAERSGTYITIPIAGGSWGAFINWECTAWKSFLAAFALIMATDFAMNKKVRGLAVIIPALFVVNLVRILFMFHFVHSYDLMFYQLVHTVIWSWGLILAILAMWTGWVRFNMPVARV